METLEILQKQLPNLQAATDRVKILQKENANFAQTKQTYRHTHTAWRMLLARITSQEIKRPTKHCEHIHYMPRGAFNSGRMARMFPPLKISVAGPQSLIQPNKQVINPIQYNQVFQNLAYQQQPSYQLQVASFVKQLLQILQPNSNPMNYNNYHALYRMNPNNVPVFDLRNVYARDGQFPWW